jgi:DNA-binding FrmR family transcriptional regulator
MQHEDVALAAHAHLDTRPDERRGALAQTDCADRVRSYNRLRRIEGQVRGLQRMIEEERQCADVLTQIASVQEALRAVGRELLRDHLKQSTRAAMHRGDGAAEAVCDELVELVFRHGR